MATVEFEGPSGRTLTLKLFTEHTDTQVVSVAATERTNKKGWYTATVTGQSGTRDVSVQDAGGFPFVTGKIDLQDDSGTYEPYTSLTRRIAEPSGPPSFGDDWWAHFSWLMVGALNKLVVNDGQLALRNAADDADLATFSHSDDGNTFTQDGAT